MNHLAITLEKQQTMKRLAITLLLASFTLPVLIGCDEAEPVGGNVVAGATEAEKEAYRQGYDDQVQAMQEMEAMTQNEGGLQ